MGKKSFEIQSQIPVETPTSTKQTEQHDTEIEKASAWGKPKARSYAVVALVLAAVWYINPFRTKSEDGITLTNLWNQLSGLPDIIGVPSLKRWAVILGGGSLLTWVGKWMWNRTKYKGDESQPESDHSETWLRCLSIPSKKGNLPKKDQDKSNFSLTVLIVVVIAIFLVLVYCCFAKRRTNHPEDMFADNESIVSSEDSIAELEAEAAMLNELIALEAVDTGVTKVKRGRVVFPRNHPVARFKRLQRKLKVNHRTQRAHIS